MIAILIYLALFVPTTSFQTSTTYIYRQNSHYVTKSCFSNTQPLHHHCKTILSAKKTTNENQLYDETTTSNLQQYQSQSQTPLLIITFTLISILYWYLLVFGAAAASAGLPVPSFLPMIPGWPPSEQDLLPAVQDSIHFFYISDLLNALSPVETTTSTTTSVGATVEELPQLRLAYFNFAEAWVFSFLPLLLKDQNRLPFPVVLGTWFGALGLTNAFLAPYLAIRQFFIAQKKKESSDDNGGDDSTNMIDKSIDSKVVNVGIGAIASIVVGYALVQTIITTVSAPNEWIDFATLLKTDRTYLAFAVDLTLFAFFQSFLLDEVDSQQTANTGSGGEYGDDDNEGILNVKVPFFGLIAWLFK